MTRTWWERAAEKQRQLGWTNAELARRTGIKYSALGKMLNGVVENPRGDALEKIADALGVSKVWLLFGKDGGKLAIGGAATIRRIPFVPLYEVPNMGAVGSIDDASVSVLATADTPDSTIATSVGDDSMRPEIAGDDILLVDVNGRPAPGKCVLAVVLPNQQPVIRRYRVRSVDAHGHEQAELVPTNPDFPGIMAQTPLPNQLESLRVQQHEEVVM